MFLCLLPKGLTTANTTLFTYASGETWENYTDVNFVPIFFNANLTIMFPDAAKRLEAVKLCHNAR